MTSPPIKIAYLGPELPALSATFVYEELLGLERRGLSVVPFSVQRPAHAPAQQAALARRTQVLYDQPAALLALQGLMALPRFGGRTFKALGWLLRDMLSVGPHRLMAWKLAYQCLTGARLARRLVAEHCAHLHVHFAHTPTQIAMYASAFSGVPFTVMAHANDIFERGLLLPQKAQRAAKLVTISQYNLAYLRSVGVPPAQLAVVRCGVSFEPRADVPPYTHKPLYRVGTLCRLVEKKGVDDLIRTLPLLANAPWRVELSIAGDGPLQAALQALVRELKVEHQVQFVGALGHEAVTSWLQSLDVFAVACKKDANGDMDGIPVVLMEAMSQRVPVLSTRLSGIPELVVHEQTGLLSEPANPQALAAELRRLLQNPELRAQLAQAGCLHVQAEFGQQVNLDRLLHHFNLTSFTKAFIKGQPTP
jgi:colanic acid/amylovoran biosynthesis glycosyltransferase